MRPAAFQALLSALLFGASAPLAKRLLDGAGPQILAGLLYLGAGAAVTMAELSRRTGGEARLRRQDLPLLAGIVLLGGIAGPLLLLLGLARVSGLAGALLLNLEAPLTIVLAVLFFGEHLARREAAGAVCILLGAFALGLGPGEARAHWVGVAAVAGACIAWAIDTNLTARLSLRDPLAVTRVKCLAAGATNLGIGIALGGRLPSPAVGAAALAVGAVCYGASLVLSVRAMRSLGAARQAAWFAGAPFAGALLAIPVLHERPTVRDGIAALVMAGGAVLLATARHGHRHSHAPLTHDHRHVHDEHHRHAHDGPVDEPHSHEHTHEALTHDHPHVSDEHHRHRH